MLALKPLQSPESVCPVCDRHNGAFNQYDFYGSQIISQGKCEHCSTRYYHNWPIGHGAHFPLTFTNNGKARYSAKAEAWLAKPLINAVKQKLNSPANIHRTVVRPIRHGILLNCLDPCFGHVLWRLFNATRFKDLDPPQGLIVLIPKQCRWLVPDYAAEVWEIDLPLNKFQQRLQGLPEFIETLPLESLQLANIKTHPDHQNLPLSDFLKMPGFELAKFTERPLEVTFIWREDRFWLRSGFENYLWRAAVKFNVSGLFSWLCFRQGNAMKQVMNRLQREYPRSRFNIAGIGSRGEFPQMNDLRKQHPNEDDELAWCRLYARSHLVIGVHGSNMILPTALAAGFIELLPRFKIPFITEDILLRHPPRYQLYLGRHLDLPVSANLLAQHIIDLYRSFSYLQSNTEEDGE